MWFDEQVLSLYLHKKWLHEPDLFLHLHKNVFPFINTKMYFMKQFHLETKWFHEWIPPLHLHKKEVSWRSDIVFLNTKYNPWTSPVPSSKQKKIHGPVPYRHLHKTWSMNQPYPFYTKNYPCTSPTPSSSQNMNQRCPFIYTKMIHEPAPSLHLHKTWHINHPCPFIYTKMIHDWHEPVPPLLLHK